MLTRAVLALFLWGAASPAWSQDILSLDGLLAHVDSAYPKLLGAAAERDLASAKRLSKQGAFDPTVALGVESQRYNSSSSRGKASRFSGTTLEWEGLTQDGAKWRVGRIANVGSVKSPASSAGSAGTYFAEVKFPLLRSQGVNEKSVALAQARLGESVAEQERLSVLRDVYREAGLAYYKWCGGVAKRDVARKLLAVAEQRLRGIYREIELEQRAKIEGVEAEAEVDLRRASLAAAERAAEEAALKLDKFLWDRRTARALSPTALPRPKLTSDDAAREAERMAVERRPELSQLARESETARLDGDLARNDRRIALDLVLAPGRDLGTNGIGETLKAGFTASLPLYQRDAKGREEAARLKQIKLAQAQELERRAAELEVRDAVSAANRAYERFLAASANLDRTEQVETGELKLFRAGASDLFRVNLRERATAESASRLIDVQVDWVQAKLSLLAATMELMGEERDVALSGLR